MPRDGLTGNYTKPFESVVTGTIIESVEHNGTVDDIVIDLNAARPIVAGGTGATNATDARKNLGVEAASARVTNYDTHVFTPGSFYSTDTATSPPVDGHAFAGLCYGVADTVTPANTKLVLEARDLGDDNTPGAVWVREKTGASAWTAWVVDSLASDGDDVVVIDGDTTIGGELVVEGDATHNGDVTIDKANPALILDKTATVGQVNAIVGSTNGLTRWVVILGDQTAESGTQTGSDFLIKRSDNFGNLLDGVNGPLEILRETGYVGVKYGLGCEGPFTAYGPISFNQPLTVSSSINVESTGPSLNLNRIGVTNPMTIRGTQVSGGAGIGQRWQMDLGDAAPESGGNAGTNFVLNRFADNSAFLGIPFQINRASGTTQFAASDIATIIGITAPGSNTLYQNGGVLVGSVTTNASITAYNTSSDARLKEDLRSFDVAASAIVEATNVYDFRWKKTGERTYGVVAQEAEAIYPAAVTHDEKNDWWGIDYSKYVPVILQELKALRARVAELEERLEAKPS